MIMDNNTIDIFLLILQAILWAVSVYHLWKRNRFYSIFGMVLYLYLLPTEISYRFYPEFYDYYWGATAWYTYFWYVTLSLLVLFIVLNHTVKPKRVYNVVRYKQWHFGRVVWLFVVSYSLLFTYLLYSNIGMISYQALVQNGAMGGEDTMLTTIDALSKFLPAFAIFPIIAMKNSKWYLQLFALYNIILSFVYNTISGSRSDILAVTVGLVLIWMYGRKIGLKQMLAIGGVAIVFLFVAGIAFTLRGGTNDGTLAETLLMQDYSGPAYNILAVIGKDIISPILLIKSQFLKVFPLMGGEWMYIPIGKIAFPTVEMSGSQGMGFHPFAEGYLFAGFFGFVYNGLIVGWGLALWNRFMSTNDERFNRFMFAVMGSLFFALVREQTVWFIRYIYFSFIPAIYIYSRLCNVSIRYTGFLSRLVKHV